MPKVFSVASWNVEHFGRKPARVRRIGEFIGGQHGGPARIPDVFALYEVEGKDVYRQFMDRFPDHRFHLTEGKQTQEIFVGVRRNLQSFTTQRLEYKTGRQHQRPGLFLTIRAGGADYSLLFLHIKSGPNPEDFGLRDAALEHAFNLKKALDKAAPGGQANFIFLGDLNTMGIDDTAPYSKVLDFAGAEEIERMAKWAGRRGMTRVEKDQTAIGGVPREVTWWNGSSNYQPSDLDHVVASNILGIRKQGTGDGVSVLGWPKLPPGQWQSWFKKFSDHAMLYFEVWT